MSFICNFATLPYSAHGRHARRAAERANPPSSSVKGESWKEGRRNEAEGEGKQNQTELCLTSLLTERRKTDTKPVRPSRRERGEEWREGSGNKCHKSGRDTKVKKDAREQHQFSPARNKKHCVRERELVSSGTRQMQCENRQTSAAAQQKSSVCLFLPASTEPWHDLRRDSGVLIRILDLYVFRRREISTCCHF